MASSNNNAQKFSYLDGVPFAINPIFLNDSQKENINANENDLNYNLENALAITNYKYEFWIELKTLSLNEDKKMCKKDFVGGGKRSRKKTDASSTISTVENNDLPVGQSSISGTTSIQSSVASATPPIINFSILLEPTRQNGTFNKLTYAPHSPNQPQTLTNKSNSSDANNSIHRDLFIDSSQSLDPFNDCELKTINDLEELKTILQNHQIHQQQQQQQQQQQLSQTIHSSIVLTNQSCPVDSFGLPIVTDLDINSNKI